jgi:hypothetical protein
MSELLSTAQYYIRNDNLFAGRNIREDKSLLPKRVFCPTDNDRPDPWEIRALPNGRYRLSTRGAPTGAKDRLLFAFLLEDQGAEEWVITRRNGGLYTIESADRNAGWVAQVDATDPQIAVRPLIVGPSDPPFFPPNELWNIQPLVD